MSAGLAGVFAEGAVGAVVAAEGGEGDEDFFGVGDECAFALCAEGGGCGEEIGEPVEWKRWMADSRSRILPRGVCSLVRSMTDCAFCG